MELKSPAFKEAGEIPKRHSCEGEDVSPALTWAGVPAAAQSLVVMCEDPDAPFKTFTHWLVYDLSPALHGLDENVPKEGDVLGGGRQGKNDFGRVGFGGPCPPTGPFHRYYFTLLALDVKLGLPAGASKADVDAAVKGHVLASSRLMGRYKKVPLGRFVRTVLHR